MNIGGGLVRINPVPQQHSEDFPRRGRISCDPSGIELAVQEGFYSCPKHQELTCKPGPRTKPDQIKVPQHKVSSWVSQTQKGSQPCSATKFCSAPHQSTLPSLLFFRGEEVLQILNPRNPFHIIYMSLLTRIVKREWGNKLQNYLQGQESRAWPHQPEILMWNSRKITKRRHFCWTLTVNSSTGSEPQHTPNTANPKHSTPTPCYSCCASATLIRKLRQLNPPALTVSFISSPGVSSLRQEISLELNPRCLSSNPQGFPKEWDICLASLDDLLGSINCSLALSYTQSQGV